MSKITAIVSAYFDAQYLAGRLDNLLAQKPKPEIVVVCQTDSAEHTIAMGYKGVEIVTTPDIPTIYAAWNMAIKRATGDYLTNANCDDRLYPGALAALTKVLDKNPKYAVVYADADVVEAVDGPPIGAFEWAEGGIEQLLRGCFVGPMPMWRKSLHDKYGLFDGEMYSAGDYEFWLRIAKADERLYHFRGSLGAYLKRQDSAEHRESLRSLWEQARAKARYREGVGIWKTPSPMTA